MSRSAGVVDKRHCSAVLLLPIVLNYLHLLLLLLCLLLLDMHVEVSGGSIHLVSEVGQQALLVYRLATQKLSSSRQASHS